MRSLIALAAACGLGLLPAIASAETVAIVGGTVYPISGPRIANGTVVITDGRISAVGANLAAPKGARTIDARGKIVTPGLINAATEIGISEVGGERATNNASAHGPIAAAFQPWYGFFSESAYIAATRQDGITTVGIVPTGGLISGQLAMMDLERGTASDMLLRGPVAMGASLRSGRFDGSLYDEDMAGASDTAGNQIDNAPNSRGEAFGRLRVLFDDVRYYAKHRGSYDSGNARGLATGRDDLQALIPVVNGTEPLLLQADRVDDIDWALRFAKDEHIRLIVAGGAEAWKIAGRIAAAHVPVLAGAMNNLPTSFDTLNQRHENLSLLRKAGVEVVIIGNSGGGDEAGFNVRNIRYEAGNAVVAGLSHDEALRAITLAPATVFGVADKVGSLAAGKNANVVVWSGDPFEFATRAEHVFVRGHEINERSRQDQLIDRYLKLPAHN